MSLARQDLFDAIAPRETAWLEVIQAAGAEARRGFAARSGREPTLKGPQKSLMETDLAVEKLIWSCLTDRFADDGTLGEETGLAGQLAGCSDRRGDDREMFAPDAM